MAFAEFTTSTGSPPSTTMVNLFEVLFVNKAAGDCILVMTDGSNIAVKETYDRIKEIMRGIN